MTATAPAPTAPTQKKSRPPATADHGHRDWVWGLGFLLIVVLLFLYYGKIQFQLEDNISGQVSKWLPIQSVNQAMVWMIMALGLNVVVGYAGLLDLGYVAFWAVGGYAAGWLMSPPWDHDINFSLLGPPTAPGVDVAGVHVSFWLVLIAGALVCVLAGIIIGAPTLRLRGDYLALVTLGFGEMVRQLAQNGSNVLGFNLTNGTTGIYGLDGIGTGWLYNIELPSWLSEHGGVPAQITAAGPEDFKLLVLAFIVGICIFISLRIRRGRLGRAWLAIREDELAASMMGVSLVKAKLSAYAVGAFFGGLGGVAYAAGVTGAVSSEKFEFSVSITVLLMVVLGGMGNVWGVMLGAFVLSWVDSAGLNQFGLQWDSWFGTDWAPKFKAHQFGLFGVVLVLMMLFRREGILPEQRTRAIMREPSRTESESVGADIAIAEAEDEIVAETDPTTEKGLSS